MVVVSLLLLHYLSPLPADKVDFTKNGYKEIVIEHLGNTYKLINDFKENKHSFYWLKHQWRTQYRWYNYLPDSVSEGLL